jgi:queuine tRNA-ribosyltransferase subunit QTRTD1
MTRLDSMSEGTMFKVTTSSTSSAVRTGVLSLPNRQSIKTPHYLALASRGAIPHLTQDNVAKHTNIRGAYMAAEDCMFPLRNTRLNSEADRTCVLTKRIKKS